MTPCRRNFVYLRVALHLSGRLTERLTRKSIRSAIRRDVKWFDRKDKLEFELPHGIARMSREAADLA